MAETTPGFRFDRVEVFSGAGLTNAIAVLVHEKTELEFSLIPPGSFLMGSPAGEGGPDPEAHLQHRVTLTRPFLIARTECTQRAWDRFGGQDDRFYRASDLPIETVGWSAVDRWCKRVELRLPTEAEWEYACRAGTTSRFWTGDSDADLSVAGWTASSSGFHSHPVGTKPANSFGLHDVHGNVGEWVADWRAAYPIGPVADPTGPSTPTESRVSRGGSFTFVAWGATSAIRRLGALDDAPSAHFHEVGFRPAATVVID